MGIVYVECCEKKCCCCCDDKRDKCPKPVRRNELASCEVSRQMLAMQGPVVVPMVNLTYIFTNATLKYDSSYCPLLTGYRTPTVAELQSIATSLTSTGSIGGTPLCPMVVWALNGIEPVLVEVVPALGTVEVLRTPSLRCKAYRICVTTTTPANG
ncbi:hypothetical protein [Sutcliffiella horikoshii]|uniref:Uncharacterized protein n=1 Tax=Sutcliffiella horikoshii TaxID=79883 RepID=A0AA94WT77_9BACI|nr:hypothetical protein [Sutcliffiella horikoshii]TYS61153.1 hypothetical protein FZC74_02445 [Sutcliffiella horikoshii]